VFECRTTLKVVVFLFSIATFPFCEFSFLLLQAKVYFYALNLFLEKERKREREKSKEKETYKQIKRGIIKNHHVNQVGFCSVFIHTLLLHSSSL